MIFQKSTLNMKLKAAMKVLDKCNCIVRFQKILTKAYLMNGMIKLEYLEKVSQKNTISKELD